ncbi:MAG: hypothetical protein COV59_00175 [Candidatus Magasanikbacteria bacterium CG11_big_fil_rev_8_21_14_0_20_39_34]|uniref:Phosphoribosyl-ATP pyrophosphohydrolase n=1 Tax=Candidatus Magasanikbacteria bacterium CG11_big_fil_rev_8_21_14_0_20_39_34 TaxID=1974653 RepID=A0A2H0N6L7_9BACT|nr:MAG: hypothetical protein COV59_00175 [Candidatus Magasanikbacteria bacterium CG11_big_fil_rev_8_21_14_0_20_39_34]
MNEKQVAYEIETLQKDDYRLELKRKLVEEAEEFLQASESEDILNELADVVEVLRAIQEEFDIEDTALEQRRKVRFEKKGGFKKKIFLLWSGDKT